MIREKRNKLLKSLKNGLTMAQEYGNIELSKETTFRYGAYHKTLEEGYVVPDAPEEFVAKFCKLMDIVDLAFKSNIISVSDMKKIALEVGETYT